ncbi:MAG: DinB family protein [Acidobacteriota bacterium]|nr:DinB family protein [Acidobacteriota bacterium]
MSRPEKNEYAEYYETYVSLVEETDIVSALRNQLAEFENLFAGISEEKGAHSYAEGKWSIRELIGHLIDGERVFAYRAFRISRADRTPLAGFEQDDYIRYGNFNNRALADLVEEFSLLRKANNILFKNLPAEAWSRIGTASEAEVSVRALAYIMVGHVRHHVNILKERYLNA